MPRFAEIDPAAPWPRPVRGWYDTDALAYATLPDGLVPVPDAAWERRLEHPQSVAEDGAFVDMPMPPLAPSPRTMPPLEFMDRFTDAESDALMTAALANKAVLRWTLRLSAAGYVDLDDPQTKAGLDALVAAGLLTAARRTAVLA